ncbi:MAG: hypothetical protein K5847_07195 [Lachnospiraceae bacterium]|nr:hypothetical protein [Lachnospiraceae bacterium]
MEDKGKLMDIELEIVNGGTDEQEPSGPEIVTPGEGGEPIHLKDNPGGNGEVWHHKFP